MSETQTVTLRQLHNYQFQTEFSPELPKLVSDEPEPLGAGSGPNPVSLLLAAVGACMSSSFHFAMTKFRESPGTIITTATAAIGRDENKRLRVQNIDIMIKFENSASAIGHLDRILGQFEQFCTVGASVARGIPIKVSVTDGSGALLKT